jgi:hypothetical protein
MISSTPPASAIIESLVRLGCASLEMNRTGGGFGNEDGESVSGSKGGVSRSRSSDGADFSWA